jgi:hypothetical protein
VKIGFEPGHGCDSGRQRTLLRLVLGRATDREEGEEGLL